MGPKDYGKEWEQKAVAGNANWIKEQDLKGVDFIDIGTDKAANRNSFYAAEKRHCRGLVQEFSRVASVL